MDCRTAGATSQAIPGTIPFCTKCSKTPKVERQIVRFKKWIFRRGFNSKKNLNLGISKKSFQKWSIQVLARGIEHIVWSICGIFMELDPA